MSYADFLARKIQTAPTYGQHITADDVHERLHDWQREIVAWAVRTGRAAIWADTGLGKAVFSPFAGIGSEVYTAVRLGREGIGIELKPSYWRTAVSNLRALELEMDAPTLFDEEAP